jgi:hypothetical protein
MPITSYPTIGDIAQAYQIYCRMDSFVEPVSLPVPLPDPFRAELDYVLKHVAYDVSEAAICENLIYPILKEFWKPFADELVIWSHIPLSADADLTGTPDYFVARRSPLGRWVQDKPYVLIVEAKKDDPSFGWGQCLAAMVAAQKLNGMPEQTLYGITSNGRVWQFAKLQANQYVQDPRLFTLTSLEELGAALHFTFEQCRQQLVAYLRSA